MIGQLNEQIITQITQTDRQRLLLYRGIDAKLAKVQYHRLSSLEVYSF